MVVAEVAAFAADAVQGLVVGEDGGVAWGGAAPVAAVAVPVAGVEVRGLPGAVGGEAGADGFDEGLRVGWPGGGGGEFGEEGTAEGAAAAGAAVGGGGAVLGGVQAHQCRARAVVGGGGEAEAAGAGEVGPVLAAGVDQEDGARDAGVAGVVQQGVLEVLGGQGVLAEADGVREEEVLLAGAGVEDAVAAPGQPEQVALPGGQFGVQDGPDVGLGGAAHLDAERGGLGLDALPAGVRHRQAQPDLVGRDPARAQPGGMGEGVDGRAVGQRDEVGVVLVLLDADEDRVRGARVDAFEGAGHAPRRRASSRWTSGLGK